MRRIHLFDSAVDESARSVATGRLVQAIPGWPVPSSRDQRPSVQTAVIGVLPGEGIGPEVIGATVEVLQSVSQCWGKACDIRYGGAIGKAAEQAHGRALTPQVIRFCESVFDDGGAILCGAGGGRFVYDLRAQFDLFCKITPVAPSPSLLDAGVVRPRARTGVNLVVVRENVGGEYFGQGSRQSDADGQITSQHTYCYSSAQVRRILTVATRLARSRSGTLSLVLKRDAIPSISDLWIEVFRELTTSDGIDARILEVDNACYQLIAKAQELDVIVAPNMIGDILSDVAALLLGSRGLSFSGNFSAAGNAVYQTGHGAAYDLTGQNRANPIGQMHSAAMMLRESFGFIDAATAIEVAIERTVAAGIRTADIAASGSKVVGTREFGCCVAQAVKNEGSQAEIAS